MRIVTLALALVMMCGASRAEDAPARSLFLSPADAALAEQKAAGSAQPGSADIALDAIMYVSPDDWSVWLQGHRRTPADRGEAPAILAVSADQVTLQIADEAGTIDKTVTLRTGESYQLADGVIKRLQRSDK